MGTNGIKKRGKTPQKKKPKTTFLAFVIQKFTVFLSAKKELKKNN
jgi:hypothetical protein